MKNKLLISSLLLSSLQTATAAELVYQPQNTAFGGNNASATQILMSKAQAQDTIENPDQAEAQSALDRFKDSLERRILDQIAREIVSGAFNADGDVLDDAGTFSTEDFAITVNQDDPDMISVSISEFTSGSETILEIPKF